MNLLQDGTGWILPPRCAARYTLGVLWRYGVTQIAYHDIDPAVKPDRIIMNIRNPYSRLRSWLRLWNTTIDGHIDAVEYFQNLHSGEHGVQFVNLIENPNGRHCHWKYVVPLSAYLTHLEQNEMDMPFAFVRQEHLESDMDTLEYPTMGYKVEPGESFERVPTNESEFAGHIRTGFNVKPTDVKWEAGDG